MHRSRTITCSFAPVIQSSTENLTNRYTIFPVSVFIMLTTAASADDPRCGHLLESVATRTRRTQQLNTRQNRFDESCRTYGDLLFELAKARQRASLCEHESDRREVLEILDAGLISLNDLIAQECGR
jgi:hypothetical protein